LKRNRFARPVATAHQRARKQRGLSIEIMQRKRLFAFDNADMAGVGGDALSEVVGDCFVASDAGAHEFVGSASVPAHLPAANVPHDTNLPFV
jgi:hypothetical protein